MQIAAWNVRGLNQAPKQLEVRSFISSQKLMLVALLETRVQERHAGDISHNIMPGWNWEFNYDTCGGGRIWVGYDSNALSVLTSFKSDQVIHIIVSSAVLPSPLVISCIYARNEEVDQARLWNSLTGLGGSTASDPWLLLEISMCVAIILRCEVATPLSL